MKNLTTENSKLVPWAVRSAVKYPCTEGSEGDLIKSGGEWYILCLRIGSPKDGRWYARKSDGTQWSISVRRASEWLPRYDWTSDKIYNYDTKRYTKNKFLKQREQWLEILNAGQDRAHEIRNRISTRRMNTVMRRSSYGGW